MGRKNVPVKTDKGAREISERTLGLAPRIRTALLLVDGLKSVTELESLMAAAGVTPGALQLLLDKGLIRFLDENKRAGSAPGVVPSAAACISPPAVEVITLLELETILDVATQLEVQTIVEVATILELAPTQIIAPEIVAEAFASESQSPFLASAKPEHRPTAVSKSFASAAVLHMNLVVARAHLANALDHFIGIDGYILKQRVIACESRVALEQLFRLVEGTLVQKVNKPVAARLMGIAQAILERNKL